MSGLVELVAAVGTTTSRHSVARLQEYLTPCARSIWSLVVAVQPEIGLPVIVPTDDGGLQLSWTVARRHLSIDIYENEWDWFYRDRETGEIDGGEATSDGDLPQSLRRRLDLVFSQARLAMMKNKL